mmetsp:Transcript_96449/g.269899  ORF Transcript_96449/g.269899 Transcript_96449/m.269899 type:complete len:272 (+) Transcript_96449:837-1652(+)
MRTYSASSASRAKASPSGASSSSSSGLISRGLGMPEPSMSSCVVAKASSSTTGIKLSLERFPACCNRPMSTFASSRVNPLPRKSRNLSVLVSESKLRRIVCNSVSTKGGGSSTFLGAPCSPALAALSAASFSSNSRNMAAARLLPMRKPSRSFDPYRQWNRMEASSASSSPSSAAFSSSSMRTGSNSSQSPVRTKRCGPYHSAFDGAGHSSARAVLVRRARRSPMHNESFSNCSSLAASSSRGSGTKSGSSSGSGFKKCFTLGKQRQGIRG